MSRLDAGSNELSICTVICRNYRAQARVLARSFRAAGYDGACVVLVLDAGEADEVLDSDLYRTIGPQDIGLPNFDAMAGYYDALELSTAVKPWLLNWMLDEYGDFGPIAYFDPDILIISRMTELDDLLDAESIVLTPHITEPMPLDGKAPSEQQLLLAGTYNLGFIALSSTTESRRMLRWWEERLQFGCIVDPPNGFFVDQRFVDFVPGLFDSVAILRHPGYNVAYWNLATRQLQTTDSGDLSVDGHALRFMHFSGFDPRDPGVMSKHQDRMALGGGSVVDDVFGDYRLQLLSAEYEIYSAIAYGYKETSSGQLLTPFVRRLFKAHAGEEATATLFTEEGEAEFRRFLSAPDATRPGLTRGESAIVAQRPDLDSPSADVVRERLRVDGAVAPHLGELALPGRLSLGPRAARSSSAGFDSFFAGANVLGYLNSTVGVGEVARRMVAAMDELRVPVWPVPLEASLHDGDVPFFVPGRADGLPFGHSLVFANADALPQVAESFRGAGFDDRFVTGMWWWELDTFPDYFIRAFDDVHQLLAGSTFIAEGLRNISPVPVHHVPIPIWIDGAPSSDRTVFGPQAAAAETVFFFAFDYHSVFERKNPLGLVEAYCSAFVEQDGAHLVIKSINQDHYPAQRDALHHAVGGRRDITLIEGFVAPRVRDLMAASCDCYVSLHRSEGLGMTMGEAMFAGKPVIATGYSGNLDFMSEANSLLVPYRLAKVGDGAPPYAPDAVWADPDLGAAANSMRLVHADQRMRQDLGVVAAKSIRTTNSIAAAAAALRGVFS